MPSTPIQTALLPEDPLGSHKPLLPTVVMGTYKGGAWKTTLAVTIAERLAWAGLRVLLLTCDTQEDARARLGVKPTEPMVTRREYGGGGSITVVGIRGAKAVDLLYRVGPQGFDIPGPFDIAIVDTPPEVQAVRLPGVLLIATVDGADAARNLIKALRSTPTNTDIILVRAGRDDRQEWAQNVDTIQQALGRSLRFIDEPLPREDVIAEAHNVGRSVWTLSKHGGTRLFLSGMETLAQTVWEQFMPGRRWPAMQPTPSPRVYVPGWDDRQ